MEKTIEIVDRGRGPQLSSSRITVQDLVPYLQQNCSYDEIRDIMPTLSIAEIQAVERYVADHFADVMEQDRRIRERSSNRQNPPEIEDILRRGGEKLQVLRDQFAKKTRPRERNGDSLGG